jgi:hypothetical protein
MHQIITEIESLICAFRKGRQGESYMFDAGNGIVMIIQHIYDLLNQA